MNQFEFRKSKRYNWQKANLTMQFLVICLALFLYMTTLLGIVPIISQYYTDRRCVELEAPDCGAENVSASASSVDFCCVACFASPAHILLVANDLWLCFLTNDYAFIVVNVDYGKCKLW